MPNARAKANYEYAKKNYKRIPVMIPKESADKLKVLANAEGVSMNRYIVEALEEKSGLKLTLDNALPWIQKDK